MPMLQKHFFNDQVSGFSMMFNEIEGVPFSKLLTKQGLCLNFNLEPMESLLHIEKYSETCEYFYLTFITFFSVSNDFFYEPPLWFEEYRSGRENMNLPFKASSKNAGLRMPLGTSKSASKENIYEPLDGFRVIIHNTDEFPFRAGRLMRLKATESLVIGVTPELALIDEALKTWSPQMRHCFLDGERKLKYFKKYTRINCEHECLGGAILEACGCVPFYIIR